MRREGLEQNQEIAQHGNRLRFPGHRVVHKNHQRGNRRVEAQAVEVFGDFLDAGVQRLQLRRRRRHVFDGGIQFDQIQQFSASLRLCGCFRLFKFRFALFVHEQPPDAAEETINALDALGAPRLDHLAAGP